jgi:hypothetical protein
MGIKSAGNIRFIGELFKLGMLTTNIMQHCIKHLLMEEDGHWSVYANYSQLWEGSWEQESGPVRTLQ